MSQDTDLEAGHKGRAAFFKKKSVWMFSSAPPLTVECGIGRVNGLETETHAVIETANVVIGRAREAGHRGQHAQQQHLSEKDETTKTPR